MSGLYDVRTAEDIRDDMLRSLANELPTVGRQPGSTASLEYGGIAAGIADVHQHVDAVARSVTPLDADEPGLEIWSDALNLPRKGGTVSSGLQALRIEGTPAILIPAGTALTSQSGVMYETSNPATIGSDGTVLADVESVETGLATNLSAGEVLTFDVVIPGVAASAILVRTLTGGTDQESLGAWRERQLAVWREKRQGGSRTDYEQWTLELDWVSRAYVYPRKPTISSVGIVALRAGDILLPSPTQVAELEALLDERRPVTDDPIVFSVVETRVDVDITVVLLPGFVPDWTEPGGGLTLDTYDAVSRTLTTNETLPSDLVAGALLTVVEDPVTTSDGTPVRVAAVLDPNNVVLGAPLSFTPVGGESILASSQAMADARQAILDGDTGCDNLQIVGLELLGPANPAKIYGTWEADVRADLIQAIALTQPGIASAVADIPIAPGGIVVSQEFPYPNDTTVELLRPGQVTVHV